MYVVGPSGAGKDTVLQAALALAPQLKLAPRYVTRPCRAGDDRHEPVSRAAFERLLAAGRLALRWQANDFLYGIDAIVDDWLGAGFDVLVNGSRAAWPAVRARYPDAIGVRISASDATLAERLARRGREDRAQLEARLRRNAGLGTLEGIALELVNEDCPEAAARRLLAWLAPQAALQGASRAA